MNSVRILLKKVVAIIAKTTMTKVITGVIAVGLVGGTTAGVIAYNSDNKDKDKPSYSEESVEANKDIEVKEVKEEIKPVEEVKAVEQQVEEEKKKVEEAQKVAEVQKTVQAVNSSQEQTIRPSKPVAPQPVPETVIHKPAGYNAELTARVNQAMLDARITVSGNIYDAFENYVMNGAALPVIDFPSAKSTGEVTTVSLSIDENTSNLTQYFVGGSSVRAAIGTNVGGVNYSKVECDGNGIANITIYHLVVVSK